ncbi:uncharacterized protein LOC144224646 [Crocuta crocuta]
MNPGPLKRLRAGVGGVAWQSHQQPLCRASARRGGEGDGKSGGAATSLTSRPLERKKPGWERKRRRRKGWVRGRVRSPAEEEPGPSRRYAGVTRAGHSSQPRPVFPSYPAGQWAGLPSLPLAVHTHAYRGAGASLKLRPRPPPRAAAGASPALRGSRARHSHKMSALTELLPAATLRPSPLLLPLHRRVSVRQRRRREHRTNLRVKGDGLLPTSRAEFIYATPISFFSEQHLLTKQIGDWTGRAGAGGGSWAGGKGGRTAETLRLREASRTGRRPWEEEANVQEW